MSRQRCTLQTPPFLSLFIVSGEGLNALVPCVQLPQQDIYERHYGIEYPSEKNYLSTFSPVEGMEYIKFSSKELRPVDKTKEQTCAASGLSLGEFVDILKDVPIQRIEGLILELTKDVYVVPKIKDDFFRFMEKNSLSYFPRFTGKGTVYKISQGYLPLLKKKGIHCDIVDIPNIGDLPLEERNRIKMSSGTNIDRQTALKARLDKKYGIE